MQIEKQTKKNVSLRTSWYDRTNSALISALLLFTFLTVTLFAIWATGDSEQWTSRFVEPLRPAPFPEEGPTEVSLVVPVFHEQFEMKLDDLIESIPAVTKELSSIESGGIIGFSMNNRGPEGWGVRLPSPIEPIPEYRRWKISYSADSLDEYAAQLDQAEIEIGAVFLAENKIVRLTKLSDSVPQSIDSDRESEADHLYFIHQQKRLRKWDRRFARNAEIQGDYELVHFFSEAATAHLRDVELKYLEEHSIKLSDVTSTQFELIPNQDRWEFRVTEVQTKNNSKVN